MRFFTSNRDLLLILLISLIPLYPLLNPGLPITHDGQDHVARIANFYQSLSEGSIIPRWAGNLNWGFGHPILMFLYPLPSYSASLFHFLGFNLVDSVKLVFGISFILSGLFMYLWIRNFLGSTSGLVAAVLYLFAPYRFVDLYVRGAIGEHVAFVFPPLILYFLLKLSKRLSYLNIAGATVSLAGLLLAHNALAIMFLPFIVIYGLYLVFNSKSKKKLSASYSIIAILGFGLSSFFLIPAFLEGKYTLRDIVTGSEALSRFVNFSDLIYGSWGYGISGQFTVQLGIMQWLFILLAPAGLYFLYKQKNKHAVHLYLLTFLYLVSSILIMLPVSKFIWEIFTVLQKFQFPWRFLSVSVFASAVLGAFFIYSLKNKVLQNLFLLLSIVLSMLLSMNYWKTNGYLEKSAGFYTGIYDSTTDTGESAPRWSVRFMEKRPSSQIEVIEGEAEVKQIFRKSTHHKYEIYSTHKSKLKENTLYFPGWKVYIDGEEYKGVQFQDPNHRGLMTFFVLDGHHTIDIVFEETRLRQVSNLVSIISFIGVASVLGFGLMKKIRNEKKFN